jgi:arylsulfatase
MAIVLGAASLAGPAVVAAEGESRRPNIVVILADDLGFSDLGCYGGEIDTPNLDRLAAGGLRFTQGYNTARCWPTRAALLTGYYAQAVGRDKLPGGKGGAQSGRPAWATLLPERLKGAGYRSYHSGKWHIDSNPKGTGFDRSLDVTGDGQSNYFDPTGVKADGKQLEGDDFYTTTAIGDHAVTCLAEHARDHADVPFFQYVAFTAPHFPLHAPADVIAKYRDRYLAGWDVMRAERAKRIAADGIVTTDVSEIERDLGPPYHFADAIKKLGPDEVNRPVPWDTLTNEQREFQATKMAIHAAMVDVMDREVGRIIDQLAGMGALDDTLILFLSDNGASAEMMVRGEGHDPAAPPGSRKSFLCLGPGWSSCANTPFRRHKTWVHEGGIATPWVVHWPAGSSGKGALRTQPVHVIDLVPTVLELVGVQEQQAQAAPPMQGRSFAGALRDAAAPPAHDALWWCHEGHRAVRMGDWKLVAAQGDPWELYDLAKDRCETKNLAATQPERVAALEKEWNRMADECRGMAPVVAPKKPRRLSGGRPNIILVMTDDQGYGDIASHGNPIIKTPNLDRLREQSVRLMDYHVSPTCSPTRAALMTGRHEFRSGVTHTNHERETIAKFYGMIENIDTNVGRLLSRLDAWGIAEDTLVVFTTDNGTAQGASIFNAGMKGHKGSPYRGGTRVPSFWRWPGTLPADVDVAAVTAHIDVLPTLCEIGGAVIPPVVAARRIEGRSLVPLLEDAEATWHDQLLVTHVGRWARGKAAESRYDNCRAREGRWEIVRVGNRQGGWELFDVEADPGETSDVAAEHPDVVAHLARGYDAWWADVQKDLVNENVDGPDDNPFKTAYWNQFGRDAQGGHDSQDGRQAHPKPSQRPSKKKAAVP